MSIKKNFLYNGILTVANYFFPLLTYPYISRVLGVNGVGIVNYVDNIINYYILFSTLGLASVGVREIAKCDSRNERNTAFSSLLLINIIFTALVSITLILSIYLVPNFHPYKELLWIGLSKLIFTSFLVEWFFQGIQNFKYITVRSIIVRILFVICVFIFVKDKNDYSVYYILLVITTIINAIFNIIYSRKYTIFSIRATNIKQYLKPYFTFGLNRILTSLYTTFNVIFLGIVAGTFAVGIYTTATKLYAIIMAIFTALTCAIIPQMSKMIAKKELEKVRHLVYNTINFLFILSLPIIFFCEIFAPQIIEIISGKGYESAILPFRIVILLVFVIGIEQIFNQQLLMCMNKNKGIIITTLLGAIVGITLNIVLVPSYKAIGSSLCWMLTEIVTLISASYFVWQYIKIAFPYKLFFINLLQATPYLIINYTLKVTIQNNIIAFFIAIIANFIYFILLNLFIIKNEVLINILSRTNKH